MVKTKGKIMEAVEKAIETTKETFRKGEDYLKEVSEKGVKETKKVSLGLKREKLCYELGKAAAETAMSKWQSSKKIGDLMGQIKELNKEIKNIK